MILLLVFLLTISKECVHVVLYRYGEALFMNSKLINGVTEFLNMETELSEVSYSTRRVVVQCPGEPNNDEFYINRMINR